MISSMSGPTKPRKRIYLINRDFQLRYSLAAAAVGVASTALTAVLFLFPLFQFEIIRIPRFLPWPILAAIGLAALLNVFLVGLLGVFITHRIAGPMYALVRCFRRIEMGRWAGHLRVRDGDDLRFLVRNFNTMVDGLIRTGQDDLVLLDQLEKAAESGDLEEVKQKLHTLTSRFKERMEGEVEDDE